MTKFKITFSSKSKKSLNSLLKFLNYSLKIQNIKTPLNYLKKKKIKKKISVLTSPHVNKSAQEHFEYNIYSIKIHFYLYRTKKYLVMLKKIKNKLFPDVLIQINMENSKKSDKNLIKNIINPNHFKLNLKKFNLVTQKFNNKLLRNNRVYVNNPNLLKKTSYYLSLLRCYGT